MKKLNLYFGDAITKEQWPRIVSALRNYCPGIVWAGGDNLDKPVGGGISTVTVNYISYVGVDYVAHRVGGILDSNSAPHIPKDFPQPIDGWKWVDEYTTDFDATSGMFDTLYESSDSPNGLIEIGYNDLKEGMTVIVNGAAGRIHRWDNEIARVIYFNLQGDYENPLLLFDSWNDGHEGPITYDDEWVDDVEVTQMFPACEEHKCWFMMPDYKVKYYVVDSFDPFDALNESVIKEARNSHPLYRKHIVFDSSATIDDIRAVNNFLVSMGAVGLNRHGGHSSFEEMIRYINNDGSTYIVWGDDGDNDLYYSGGNYIVGSTNKIPYQDILSLINFDPFNTLNESVLGSKRYVQKFDIGDRVVMDGTVGGKNINNELGTVIKYKLTGGGAGHPHRVYLILFDNWNDRERNFLMSRTQADQNEQFIDSRCGEGSCWYTTSDNLEPAPDSNELFSSIYESEEEEETEPIIGSTLYCHQKFGGFKVGGYYTVTDLEPCYENNCLRLNNTDFRLTIYPDSSGLSYKTWFTLVDYDETSRLFDSLNESTDTNYKPKLVLKFDPPVKRWDEMEQILTFIESLYPNTYWYGDNKKLKLNQKNIVESCHDNGVWYLHIGYYPHEPNDLTYGSDKHGYDWSDIAIDGYKWYEDNKFDTQEAFNSLYESKEDNNVKYFNLIFNPPLVSGEWPLVTEIIKELFPGRTWCNNEPLEWFPDTYGDTITILSLSEDGISYGMRQDEVFRDIPNFNGRYWLDYKGIQIPNGEIDYDETSRLFDSLNN